MELERGPGVRIEGGAGEVRIEGGAGEGNWSEDRGWSWRGDLE